MNSARYFQYQAIIFWKINKINKNPDILPNITVGWTVLADRGNAQVSG